ncbi:signal peptidase I [Enterococcus saccharolyticus]|uniref:Signal peptidase I n=1 Tax=Enterococcus saccharolyticus 30_1 TaxID=742813 RepID=A0AA87FG12_9ENTE|nr:signal peptidase I [Enterococcus saccharolyticus]EHG27758.1 signal peptidase I [Enterococcus saccharolyticus 30_1]
MKKISKTSILFSFTTLIIMLLPLLMIVIPKMLGLPIAIVKSDAMEPTYSSGSLLFVKSVDAENLIVGEAITYFVNQGEQIYTRRIAAIDQNEQVMYTIGDIQDHMETTKIRKSQLLGQPLFHLPRIGHLVTSETVSIVKKLYLVFTIYITATTFLVMISQIKQGKRMVM